jgi:IclR family pca regulon transcriptional regulator
MKDKLAGSPGAARSSGTDAVGSGAQRADSYLQSLDKGLSVLNCFDVDAASLTISEVAERSGFDRAFVRRALLTFTHLGYLQTDGKRYALTARVLSVGYRYLGALPFWKVAQPILQELSDEINETVSIGVLDQLETVFVLRVPARRLLTFDPSIGSRVPAHLNSIGQVLMAAMADDALAAYLDQITYARFTARTVTDKALLQAQLAQVREQGWSFTSEQYEQGHCGIAVPLRRGRGPVTGGLNVSLLADRHAETRAIEELLPRIQLAARRISADL